MGWQQKTAMLMSNGIVGRARIDQVSDTGTAINGNPKVMFNLTVTIRRAEHLPNVSRASGLKG